MRGIESVDELNSVPTTVKPEEMKLARQVIQMFEQPLNLADYRDKYREGLQRIIDAKITGEEVVATAAEAAPKVVNLMEALKKSLDAVSKGKKKTAKAARPAAATHKRA
jgi:DNA end-binding protein Ku